MIMAPPVERGLIAAAKEVAVIAEINSTKLTSANLLQISAAIGYMVGITTAVVELTQDKIPEEAAIMGTAVRSVMKELKPSEISLIPPKIPIMFTKTPTPQIMINVPQGIPLIAFCASAQPKKIRMVDITKAKRPVSSLKPMQQITITATEIIVIF